MNDISNSVTGQWKCGGVDPRDLFLWLQYSYST